MTVAMSLLVHGEAVRFNRGQSRGDDYDFKYMRGRDGREYPYVSSQCYKKYWREALPGPFSPIIREKDASGKDKNQAFTSGNPMGYLDDDLFGYMIAGATEGEDDSGDFDSPEGPQDTRRVFEPENLKDLEALKKRLLDGSPLSKFILQSVPDAAEGLQNPASTDDLREIILNLLDEVARKSGLFEVQGAKSPKQVAAKFKKPMGAAEMRNANREILRQTFSKELQEKQKRETTRRTAPVRMHALVAFSGIKTAKDFQTFSRDIAYTGKNSIVNPAVQGIYSGWLKTRILIESHRIGKFYIGENMDILERHVAGHEIRKESNPYSREQESVKYVQLDDTERTDRLRTVLQALADIGNKQGPASGALHDGSLRPKAFVAGLMNCTDSPFDYIWTGRNEDGMPDLDVNLLRDSIKDWEDLFATKKIYVGLPANAGRRSWGGSAVVDSITEVAESPASEIKKIIEDELKKIGFEALVDTPRKALLNLAEEATL
jgi:hypothetical protein